MTSFAPRPRALAVVALDGVAALVGPAVSEHRADRVRDNDGRRDGCPQRRVNNAADGTAAARENSDSHVNVCWSSLVCASRRIASGVVVLWSLHSHGRAATEHERRHRASHRLLALAEGGHPRRSAVHAAPVDTADILRRGTRNDQPARGRALRPLMRNRSLTCPLALLAVGERGVCLAPARGVTRDELVRVDGGRGVGHDGGVIAGARGEQDECDATHGVDRRAVGAVGHENSLFFLAQNVTVNACEQNPHACTEVA